MSEPLSATIWTRAGDRPLKVASVGKNGAVDCEEGFSDSGLPGLSLAKAAGEPPAALHHKLRAWLRQAEQSRLQRRLCAALQHPETSDADCAGWGFLTLAGHGGIGHLDLFRSDHDALQWYARTSARKEQPWPAKTAALLDRAVRKDRAATTELAAITGVPPVIGGMTPKLLAAIPDRAQWDGTMASPGTKQVGNDRFTDVVVKLEAPGYEGIAVLESLAYDMHEQAGWTTPRRWLLDQPAALAVERFDRDAQGRPLPYEGLGTLLSAKLRHTDGIDMASATRNLTKLAEAAGFDIRHTLREVFRRLAMALFTGNGDLHLENLGLLGGPSSPKLAPVFDPAPMRAWPRHDVRFAVAAEFRPGLPIYLQIARQGKAFGLTVKESWTALEEAYEATRYYPERVAASTAPEATKRRLAEVVEKERELFMAARTGRKRPGPTGS